MTQSAKKLDPVTLEILYHKLWQITKEMGINLTRVSGSSITIEARDFATGIFGAPRLRAFQLRRCARYKNGFPKTIYSRSQPGHHSLSQTLIPGCPRMLRC